MARPPRGQENVDRALQRIATATTIEQLRQVQAVLFPLRYGLSLEQTAEAIGVSRGWACRLRNQFIAGKVVGDKRQGRTRRATERKSQSRARSRTAQAVPGIGESWRHFGGRSDQTSARSRAGAHDGAVVGVQTVAST